ncbi:hypothetical protein AVEN_251347-1 [Araneus ventricosus]|uniref:Uncharacterized protein n=1 Tax=Araneus ventricosus TaxID=182803 RepID=A0A4Y2KDP0_ARAVE|nr:hypothetical protein AVEN_251347-1 [Araneus ventricosus]
MILCDVTSYQERYNNPGVAEMRQSSLNVFGVLFGGLFPSRVSHDGSFVESGVLDPGLEKNDSNKDFVVFVGLNHGKSAVDGQIPDFRVAWDF